MQLCLATRILQRHFQGCPSWRSVYLTVHLRTARTDRIKVNSARVNTSNGHAGTAFLGNNVRSNRLRLLYLREEAAGLSSALHGHSFMYFSLFCFQHLSDVTRWFCSDDCSVFFQNMSCQQAASACRLS